jgi:hypothetical protein
MPRYKDFWLVLGALTEMILPPVLMFIVWLNLVKFILQKAARLR